MNSAILITDGLTLKFADSKSVKWVNSKLNNCTYQIQAQAIFDIDNTKLKGLSTSDCGIITQNDSVIVAFGKLQCQINSLVAVGGTVTDFSSGNLSPLFTTSVATSTTTPSLTFSAVSQNQNLFYASPNGSAGVPSFRAIVNSDLASGADGTKYLRDDMTWQAVVAVNYISSVANTNTVQLAVSGGGQLTANVRYQNSSTINLSDDASGLKAVFASILISQFTNDSGYITTTGITPSALTKVDDTNVTLTLGGTPLTALLQATSITVGWSGTLSETRGGTAQSTYTTGDILYSSAANTLSKLGIGSAGQVLTVAGGIPSWATPTTGTVASVSGTANRITSTGGSTPVIDISASYVGQTSITTLGTITTGVWNGTAITNANLANSSITIGSTNISLGATSTALAGLTSVTSTTFVGALTGNATTATSLATARTISGTGEATFTTTAFDGSAAVSGAVTLTNSAVIGKVLTGYVSGAGVVAATDTILEAFQKLNGNIAALITGVSSVNSLTGAVALTGTASRITVSAANVFDISASYVGQSSITTLGTITTGVWNGTTIAVANGGTGVTTFGGTNRLLYTTSTDTLSSITAGSANQILGFTNAGTGFEYKTISTGTTAISNDIGVTLSTANSIIIQIPDASTTVRGVMTTGTQSFAGNKNFSGNIALTGLGASTLAVGSTSNVFRTTNAGSNINTQSIFDVDNSVSTAGAQAFGFETANGFIFTAANGTRRISRAALKLVNLTNTAASEAGDLAFYTQSGGTAISQKMRISGLGSVVIGNEAALATNVTDGFLYIPTCAGTPTGVPTAYTGKVAMIYDTTNNFLYFYTGGAWKKSTVYA